MHFAFAQCERTLGGQPTSKHPPAAYPKAQEDSAHPKIRKVGSFCCPVLPVPLESDSVARFGPTALFWSNFRP